MKMLRFVLVPALLLVLIHGCSEASPNHSDRTQHSEDGLTNAPAGQLADEGQWIPLFNGQNLDGWEVKAVSEEAHHSFWSVNEGVIVVNSMGQPDHDYSWLQTTAEFADFELRLKFQSYRDSPGNSGVQIRSRYDHAAKVADAPGTGWLDGPQVDIHPTGPWRTGFIYDETRGHRRWIHPDLPDWKMDSATFAPAEFLHYFADEVPHWNELTIICKGNRIKTIVNNHVIADYDGDGVLNDTHHKQYGVGNAGFIALQLHKDDQLRMAFKDILIKPL